MYEIIFLIGVVVGLLINNIYWRKIKPDGIMVIREGEDKDIYKMLVQQELSSLKSKKVVVFKIKNVK